jgi:4-amino-4-deoxy-L-arabinose transferase-like glycosyltransferase
MGSGVDKSVSAGSGKPGGSAEGARARTRLRFRRQGAPGLGWQTALALAAWLYLCSLHWDNDGLWYQGDAPRHVANGLFWKDFLASGSLDPRGYALAYYARYPAICPTVYPPAFYLLEGALFGLFGPSPFLAKGLVLGFALMAALYSLAWLRRWVAPTAGGAGALLLLLPGLTTWAHAVMLNVPALALGLAALYYARRALESSGSRYPRHLYAAAGLAVLGILTHPTTGVIVFVGVAWLAALGRWRLLAQPRTWLLALACAVLLLPWAYVAYQWAPRQFSWVVPTSARLTSRWTWMFYFRHATELSDPHLLALGGFGAFVGLARRQWRRDTVLLLLWIGTCYLVFVNFWAKESRYLLVACPALLYLCARALLAISQAAAAVRAVPGGLVFTASLGALVLVEAWLAGSRPLPSVHDFKEVVAFAEQVAPAEPVFYDGCHDGLFIFNVQAADPEYQRQVVIGSEVLYTDSPEAPPTNLIETLRTRYGCRWLVIEFGALSEGSPAARCLREALESDAFERVRSFPIARAGVDRVDVYRLLGPVGSPTKVVLPPTMPGTRAQEGVEPIRR